ncbi:HAD-IA family hydrolase [Candidatus Dependentiae bacterium]|nr:HAD-IA family hydrolase [Candidatus Dependentiae bacterium]
MIKKLSVCLFLAVSSISHAKILMWDLGGVLVDASKIGIAQEVGLGRFITHIVRDLRNPSKIQHRLFEVLGFLERPQRDLKAETGDGMLLPVIMCQWQAGTIMGKEIVERANAMIEILDKSEFFDSSSEKNLIKKTIKKMFDPVILAEHTYPIKKGYRLLEECMQVRNKDGSLRNQSFIFSNFDKQGFEQLYKTKRSLFRHFKGLIVSGQLGLIKPYDHIFNYFIEKYKLDPAECILIDDQKVNVDAARKRGFKALLVKDNNFKYIRTELIRLGAL